MDTSESRRKPDTYRNLLLAIIALALIVQVGLSSYNLMRDIQRQQQEQARQNALSNLAIQAAQSSVDNNALSDQLLKDYQKNVYNNPQVDSAPKQQVIGNDYLVAYLKLLVEQNNQLLQLIAAIR